MADDIQSNIRINIDTASAMDSIRLLQAQISAFHTQMSKMGAANAATAANMQQNLLNSINASGKFAASITTIKTSAESFTTALEKNKLSLREYFRYAGASSKTFGKYFGNEFDTINKVARERVKDLQSQYIKLGRDANGAMQAIKVRPLALDMESLGTKTQIAAQKQQLLNQLLKQGSTNLLNFGKNTQWAGRQLMVGFTIPLTIMGGAAVKAYSQMEEAAVKFKRVYGDMGTTNAQTEQMTKQVQKLALEYTKYGIAVADTMDMAAQAAAMGKTGADLLQQISNANKLSALGGVDQNKALDTTISLTNAFSIASKDLSENINFLNSVENQTVLNIDDMTTAIPKAAPVIKQLGGNVKDLAFFLTAMKEGGINASEGANAIKSGLASIINPTNTAKKMLQGFGINITEIVQKDRGNLKKTVVDFAQALDTLDPLSRARAIEQMFGKFQFARLSTLFQNITQQGTQASKVLDLANTSSVDLALLAQQELKKVESSPLFQFKKAIADFQSSLAPIGQQFLQVLTPIIKFGQSLLDGFNHLNGGVKNFIIQVVGIGGIIGPVLLMTFGLLANAVANVIKGFSLVKGIFNSAGKSSLSLGEQVSYMTQEQIQAAAVASSLDQVHSKLKQTFTSEAAAVDMLTEAYKRSILAQRGFDVPIRTRGPIPKYATGGIISGPGTGTSDSIPAMLSNGEAVIPAKSVAQNKDLVQSLINNSLPRFATGGIINGPGSVTSDSILARVSNGEAIIPAMSVVRNPDMVRQLVSGNIPGFAKGRFDDPFDLSTKIGLTRRDVVGRPGADPQTAQIHSTDAIEAGHTLASKFKNIETFLSDMENSLREMGYSQPIINDALIKANESFKKEKQYLEEQGLTAQEIADYKFQTYNERTVLQPGPVNNKGTGSFSASEVKNFYKPGTEGSFAFANFVPHLKSMKFTDKEIEQILSEMATNLHTGLSKIDDAAQMTLEDLDKLTNAAIDEAVKNNARAKKAIAKIDSADYTFKTTKQGDNSRVGVGQTYRGKQDKRIRQLEEITGIKSPYETGGRTIFKRKTFEEAGAQYSPRATQQALKQLQNAGGKFEAEANLLIRQYVDKGAAFIPELFKRIEKQLSEIGLTSLAEIETTVARNVATISTSMANGVEKGFNSATERRSPPRRLVKAGEDSGQALVSGARSQIDDAAIAGEVIGSTITKNARGGTRVISNGTVIPNEPTVILTQSKNNSEKNSTEDLSVTETRPKTLSEKFGGKVASGVSKFADLGMKGTMAGFAVSSGLAMFGGIAGPIGEVSNQLSGFAMALTSVMSVFQFLPSTIFAAEGAFMGAVAAFAAPVAIAVGAIALIAGGIYLWQKAEENRIQKLKQATDGYVTTLYGKNQDTASANIFGYTQRQFASTNAGIGKIIKNFKDYLKEERYNKIIATNDFQESFVKPPKNGPSVVEGLKTASTEEVQKELYRIALRNMASGNSDEGAMSIIEALKKAAGRFDVDLKFKSLSINTKDGRKQLLSNVNSMLDEAKAITKDKQENITTYKPYMINGKPVTPNTLGTLSETDFQLINPVSTFNPKTNKPYKPNEPILNPESGITKLTSIYSSESLAKLKIYASNFKTLFQSIGTLVKNGEMSISNYNKSFNAMLSTIEKSPNGLRLMGSLVDQLDPKIQAMLKGLKSGSEEFNTVLKGAMTGMTISDELQKKLRTPTSQEYASMGTVGFEYYAAVHATALEELKTEYNNWLKIQKEIAKITQDTKTQEQKNLDIWNAKTNKISSALDILSRKEDVVNKAYDKRIKALDDVQKANDAINQQTQDQLDLADALSRGDIAAAARAQARMTADANTTANETARTNLETGRQNALASLTIKDSTGTSYNRKTLEGMLEIVQGLMDSQALKGFDFSKYGKSKEKSGVATGGHITGPGSGTSDSIPAMLSNGEYVIRANAVKTIGVNALDKLNQADRIGFKNGGYNGYANGGMVGYAPGGMVKRDTGAPNPFLDPMGWLQGLINGTYAGGGNPSAYLDNTAAKTIKTGAKSTKQFYNDYIFDPSSPIDYATTFLPGSKILKRAGKAFKNAGTLAKAGSIAAKTKVPNMDDILTTNKLFAESMQNVYKNISLGKDYKIVIGQNKSESLFGDASYADVINGVVTNATRHFKGEILHGPKNKTVGEFSASIMKFKDELAVTDPYIQLSKNFKGKGIGKEFTSQSMALLKKMGVKTVTIDAGMSDGAYAWAKAGFKFRQYPNDLVDRMKNINSIIKDKELTQIINNFSKGKNKRNGPFNFEPADIFKLGKLSDRKTDKQLLSIANAFQKIEKENIRQYMLGNYPSEPYQVIPDIDWFKTHNLGELILRGANYVGTKKLAKGGLVGYANGGMVGYKKGGKAKNWDLEDSSAPWNQGDYKKFNDYQTRKQYWAMAQPGSREIVEAGKTAGYFMPGIGAGLAFGDAGTSFGKGDVGGGLLNTALGAGSLWIPKAISMVGKGLGTAGNFVRTKIATMNAKKVLGIMGGKEAAKLTPQITLKMRQSGLEKFISDNKYKTIHNYVKSSAGDTISNRIAIENATRMRKALRLKPSQSPAYGFLGSRESVPNTSHTIYPSQPGGLTPQELATNNFLRQINPNSRPLQTYGSASISLKESALKNATVSFGDTLSIFEQANKTGVKVPKVARLDSLLTTLKLNSLAKKTKSILGNDFSMPYAEVHLPGGFGLDDVREIGVSNEFTDRVPDLLIGMRKLLGDSGYSKLGVHDIIARGNSMYRMFGANIPSPQKYSDLLKIPVARYKSKAKQYTNTLLQKANKKFVKPIVKPFRDVKTLLLAKQYIKNAGEVPHISDLREDSAQIKYGTLMDKMNLGKGNKIAAGASVHPEHIADELGIHENDLDNDIFALISGNIKHNKNTVAGSFSGTITRNEARTSSHLNNYVRETTYSADDIYLELDKKFRGKGIAQKFTTQYIELLKKAGVTKINMNAGLTDGGYAWARAGFKFRSRPKELIQRMEKIQPYINDKKFNEILDKLKNADVKDLPMPKEILGLRTNWRKYISQKDLLNNLKNNSPLYTRDANININSKSLGELILRGSGWQGYKDLIKPLKSKKYANGGYAMPISESPPIQFAKGGLVPKYFAMGGYARGKDVVPSMLTPGEFVIKKPAADRIGSSALNNLNNGESPTASKDSVYNTYSINISVNSNSNPQDIANTVMNSIRRVDNQRIRSSRI
jgi:TP901 family phage tail tape measure protein